MRFDFPKELNLANGISLNFNFGQDNYFSTGAYVDGTVQQGQKRDTPFCQLE
jgi:hypothetical protein